METNFASRKSRILAFLLDYLILTIIIVLPIIFFMMNERNMESVLSFSFFAVWLMIGFILYILKDSIKGASIGKWVIGIGIRDEENLERVPSILRLFLRNLLIIIWPIEFLILAANKDKQRLGDRLAHTVVVKVTEVSVWRKIFAIVSLTLISILLFISTILFTIKNTDAYETAITYIEGSEEIIQEAGGIEGYGFIPSGSVQINNGYGESLFTINIKGKEKDVKVRIYLTKTPKSDWKVQEAHYE
ncbi:RDD family protein [Metabacillus fastidiosus]|uniref:RDD family protein n=1 Tax=Metabacillus fastidiosus TaxID=1458 RepID=UPI003D29FF0D